MWGIDIWLIIILVVLIIVTGVILAFQYEDFHQAIHKESGACPIYTCANKNPNLDCGSAAYRVDGDEYYCSGGSTTEPKKLLSKLT